MEKVCLVHVSLNSLVSLLSFLDNQERDMGASDRESGFSNELESSRRWSLNWEFWAVSIAK